MTYPNMPIGYIKKSELPDPARHDHRDHRYLKPVPSGDIIVNLNSEQNKYDPSVKYFNGEIYTLAGQQYKPYDRADHLAHVERTLAAKVDQVGSELKRGNEKAAELQGNTVQALVSGFAAMDTTLTTAVAAAVSRSVEETFTKLVLPLQAENIALKEQNMALEQRIRVLEAQLSGNPMSVPANIQVVAAPPTTLSSAAQAARD